MRPNRTLPLALSVATLAASAGCSELISSPAGPSAAQSDTSLAGHPGDIVHTVHVRIALSISTTDPLLPGEDVVLTVRGVAEERINGGEVVLMLPTRALMDHAGTLALPEVPIVARWELPPMGVGDVWSGKHTVPGEAEGYYQVAAHAHTHGPDGDPWLFDDVLVRAWMYVHETDGKLTEWFEDTIFPEGVHPVPGPTSGWLADSRPDTNSTNWHPDSVYFWVVYFEHVPKEEGTGTDSAFFPAVGTEMWSKNRRGEEVRRVTVPEDGVVAFKCPSQDFWGEAEVPHTQFVEGERTVVPWWWASRDDCGGLITVQVDTREDVYVPWRYLNLAADTIQKHFGHTRGRVKWEVAGRQTYYSPKEDKIVFHDGFYPHPAVLWAAAHEYGHAMHEKALGGSWTAPKCIDRGGWFNPDPARQPEFAHFPGC